MNDELKCANCKKTPGALYENPKKRGQYLCFDCLDKAAPEVVDRYAGWRERERKRAEMGNRKSAVGKKKDPTSDFLFPTSDPGLSAPLPAARSKPKAGIPKELSPALFPL
jgi:hypothetical protein